MIPANVKHVRKIHHTKFFACPLSVITPATWELLRLVNNCITAENGDIVALPFPGSLLEQPQWFLQAVEIVKNERFRYRKAKMPKSPKMAATSTEN